MKDEGLNPSVVPENMFKLGTAYTWDWGTASLFYCFFGKPPETYFPSVPTLVVNPEPKAINLVNMNVDLDLSKWMGLDKGQSTLTFRVENLFDEEVYAPTFAYSGSPNSFPYGPGRTFYTGLAINF